METEIRSIPITLEVRAATAESGPVIAGHGAVFGSPSLDLGGFQEVIDARAFNRTLKDGGLVMSYFNHDPHFVLGRTDNDTLTLRKDKTGLLFEVTPPETTWAADLLASMARADIRDASFAFQVVKDSWEERPDGTQLRTLLDVDLFEIGPVSRGAYPKADSQIRAMLESRGIKLDGDRQYSVELAAIAPIAPVLHRLKIGAPDDNDVEELRAFIAILDDLLPAELPLPDDWKTPLALRRRKLELLRLAR